MPSNSALNIRNITSQNQRADDTNTAIQESRNGAVRGFVDPTMLGERLLSFGMSHVVTQLKPHQPGRLSLPPERSDSIVPTTVLATQKKPLKGGKNVRGLFRKACNMNQLTNATSSYTAKLFRRDQVKEILTNKVKSFAQKRDQEERLWREAYPAETCEHGSDDTPLGLLNDNDLTTTHVEAILEASIPTPKPSEYNMTGWKPVQTESSFLPIPPKNSARQHRGAAEMCPIPELRIATADDSSSSARAPLKDREDVDFVFLNSTPFTLTMPAFRHGPIRISKADLKPASINGSGDSSREASESLTYLEEADHAGLLAWFEGFGVGSYGRLVTEEEE